MSVLDGVVHAAAAYKYLRRMAWFGGVYGLSILDDVVHAAAAYVYVRRVAWFGGVFGLSILTTWCKRRQRTCTCAA